MDQLLSLLYYNIIMCKYYVLKIENTRFTQVSIIIYKKGGIMYA